jgi:hypothetical protein
MNHWCTMKSALIIGLRIEIADDTHCDERCPWIKLHRGFFGPRAECTLPVEDSPFQLRIDGALGALRMKSCKENDESKLKIVSNE